MNGDYFSKNNRFVSSRFGMNLLLLEDELQCSKMEQAGNISPESGTSIVLTAQPLLLL
jgi:hypothetical protein